jgi:hypothetical protein
MRLGIHADVERIAYEKDISTRAFDMEKEFKIPPII